MNKPSFFEGVAVALIAAIIGSVTIFSLSLFFISDFALYFIIAAGSLAYIIYLLARSGEKTGRVTIIALWSLLSIGGLALSPSLSLFAFMQIGFVWMIRSLYFHNSVLAALMDLCLLGISLMVSLWAWQQTYSSFIALWSLFLTQALFVFIPSRIRQASLVGAQTRNNHDRFDTAYRAAESAKNWLINNVYS